MKWWKYFGFLRSHRTGPHIYLAVTAHCSSHQAHHPVTFRGHQCSSVVSGMRSRKCPIALVSKDSQQLPEYHGQRVAQHSMERGAWYPLVISRWLFCLSTTAVNDNPKCCHTFYRTVQGKVILLPSKFASKYNEKMYKRKKTRILRSFGKFHLIYCSCLLCHS